MDSLIEAFLTTFAVGVGVAVGFAIYRVIGRRLMRMLGLNSSDKTAGLETMLGMLVTLIILAGIFSLVLYGSLWLYGAL